MTKLIELLGDNCSRCQKFARNIRLAIKKGRNSGELRHKCDAKQLASYQLLSLLGW